MTWRIAITLLLAATPALSTDAPDVAMPDTPNGRAFGAFVAAYNTGTPEAIEQFILDYGDSSLVKMRGAARQISGYWYDIYREYGPVRLQSLIPTDDTAIEGWFHGEITEFWVGFGLKFAEKPPHGVLAGTRIHGMRPPDAASYYQARSAKQIAEYLRSYLAEVAKSDLFSGTVLVAKNGKEVFCEAYGLADRERGLPNRPETKFNIASLEKMFTGVAIAQLIQAGKVRLDDPLAKHLPEYPSPIASKVTVRHLLTHSSGIELDEIPEFNAEIKEALSVADMVKVQMRYADRLPNYATFEPLDHFDYANEDYDLLGAVIERVTGQSYDDYIAKKVLNVADMAHTGPLIRDDPPADLAVGYTARHPKHPIYLPEPRKPNWGFLNAHSRPSGGCYSTVDDLLRFTEALRRHRLLDREATEKATSPQIVIADDGTDAYGFGFQVRKQGEVSYFGHSGALPGASARCDIYPDLGYTVIVLSNAEGSASHMAGRVRDLIAP